MLRSPVVAASMVLSLPLLAIEPGTDDSFVRFKLLVGAGCVMLAVGVGVASGLAAARARRSGTMELFGSLPVSASCITSAQLLSTVASVVPAVIVLSILAVRMQVWDGLAVPAIPGTVVGAGPARLSPSLAGFLQGPALVALSGVTGVALGVWVRSSVAASMALIVSGYLLPLPMLWWSWDWQRWLVPLAHGLDTAPQLVGPHGTVLVVHGQETAAMGWHVLYLLALTAVVAAAAVARDRTRWASCLAAGGLAVGAGAGTLQLVH